MRILLINGPNLSRLGKREPEIYGATTLDELVLALKALADDLGATLEARQSNHEGDIVDWFCAAEEEHFAGILINPGAYTHSSYAIYDAIRGCGVPTVEVHISNPEAREAFRAESKVAPACIGKVAGFGIDSYRTALEALVRRLGTSSS